ncbi:MAG TPA: peptide chain release factor-like protein [Geobacteraceae bacterium]|nr:peptide chain release factor-like protein [Geobacteraceae bacterium]
MLTFSVSEEKNRWLRERMDALGVREEDLEESFIRSSGKGGQHVNKSSTCVRIRHIPTGLEVKCMAERSQSINRFLARRELLEKIAQFMEKPTQRSSEQEKVRRRKARRKRRSAAKYSETNRDGEE